MPRHWRPLALVAAGLLLTGATEQFKLTWEEPCRFVYPDGKEYPYHQPYCDYAEAKNKSARWFFSKMQLYKEQKQEEDRNTQLGFLKDNEKEASAAFDAFTRDKEKLLRETAPATVDPRKTALLRAMALSRLRKRVVEECPPLAKPFGGKELYVKDCNVRLQELDGVIKTARADVPKEQRAQLDKSYDKVFIKGSGSTLARTTGELGGMGSGADGHKLSKLFDGQQRTGGGVRGRDGAAVVGLSGNGALAAGGLRDRGASDWQAKFSGDAPKSPPPPGGKAIANGTYTLNDNVPREADGKPRLKPGDTYTVYYNEGCTHSAAFVVLQDGRIARRDSEPGHKGPIMVYKDLDSSLSPHRGATEIPKLTYVGKDGEKSLEYMKSGEPGDSAISWTARKVAAGARWVGDHTSPYSIAAPLHVFSKYVVAPVYEKVGNYSDWCASDASTIAAAQSGTGGKLAYSLAGTFPIVTQGAGSMLASKD